MSSSQPPLYQIYVVSVGGLLVFFRLMRCVFLPWLVAVPHPWSQLTFTCSSVIATIITCLFCWLIVIPLWTPSYPPIRSLLIGASFLSLWLERHHPYTTVSKKPRSELPNSHHWLLRSFFAGSLHFIDEYDKQLIITSTNESEVLPLSLTITLSAFEHSFDCVHKLWWYVLFA